WDRTRPVADLLKPVTVNVNGEDVKIGLILCEDMWSDDYSVNPISILLEHRADLIVNISCSPWTWRKNDKRHRVIRDRLAEHPAPFIYVNNTGIQNNGKNIYLFDGNTTIYNPDGSLHKVAGDYQEEILRGVISDTITERLPGLSGLNSERDSKELYKGLIYGIQKFFTSIGRNKVLLGISGGIDSGLSATLLTHALGAENVFAVNMPSRFNSETTKSAAFKLARNLGIHYASVPIQESFEYTLRQLNSVVFERQDNLENKTPVKLSALDEENVQARDRGSRLLAGLASALGAVFVNNGNKTEIAIGYVTLYGDSNGAISILGDLYKTEVYQLAGHINRMYDKEIIPKEILDLPASAELSAAQNVDEGKGDPINYPYHDKLMRAFIEFRLDPEDILKLYLEGELYETLGINKENFNDFFEDSKAFVDDLEHKWRLFKLSIFKRIQSPPIIAVSKRAFGFDLREAQNGVHFTRGYYILKKRLLGAN
ncbi:MAG: NAD(+) synthase, partial [Calditrichaceae bacterium]